MEDRVIKKKEKKPELSHDHDVEKWFKKLSSHYSNSSIQKIKKAYEFSKEAHKGQLRQSGESYISHPLGVAFILAELHLDTATLITGLLHDTVEDTDITLEQIQSEFGSSVEKLVDGVTKISKMSFRHSYYKQGENIRKMVLAMGKDVRVILVKIADRLHNMRTLHHMPNKKQTLISQETLDIYVPLASRLGMGSIKIELEDLSFKYLKPESYCDLVEKINKKKKDRERYIEERKEFLRENIQKEVSFKIEVFGRFKNLYSIYKKMEMQKISYHQIYDLMAFRICVEKASECYEVLGVIHSMLKPVPGRFKDFIAIPKKNRYQSLHTTVIGSTGEKIEIQIRTHEMHKVAEWGISAHWRYKEGKQDNVSFLEKKSIEKFNWLRELVHMHQQVDNTEEFLENIKTDLVEDEIYIFTPKGDVKEFPRGATPIDFAYSIHTDVGDHIASARVNGKLVSLRSKLKNGDTVDVMTSRHRSPSKDWSKYCVTAKAKSRIRQYIRSEQRKRAYQMGYELLEQKLHKMKLSPEKCLVGPKFEKFKKEHGCSHIDEVYIRIGYGKIQCKKLIDALISKKDRESYLGLKLLEKGLTLLKREKKSTSLIEIDGMSHLLVQYAKCCDPIPGDAITGFVTYGRGITIHRSNCKRVFDLDKERYVNVSWSRSINDEIRRIIQIQVICFNSKGLLKSMSEVIYSCDVDVMGGNIKTTSDNNAICDFRVSIKNSEQVEKVLMALRKLKGVINVKRGTFLGA